MYRRCDPSESFKRYCCLFGDFWLIYCIIFIPFLSYRDCFEFSKRFTETVDAVTHAAWPEAILKEQNVLDSNE